MSDVVALTAEIRLLRDKLKQDVAGAQSDIKSITEKNPPKLKVDVDTSSVKSAAAEVRKTMQSAMEFVPGKGFRPMVDRKAMTVDVQQATNEAVASVKPKAVKIPVETVPTEGGHGHLDPARQNLLNPRRLEHAIAPYLGGMTSAYMAFQMGEWGLEAMGAYGEASNRRNDRTEDMLQRYRFGNTSVSYSTHPDIVRRTEAAAEAQGELMKLEAWDKFPIVGSLDLNHNVKRRIQRGIELGQERNQRQIEYEETLDQGQANMAEITGDTLGAAKYRANKKAEIAKRRAEEEYNDWSEIVAPSPKLPTWREVTPADRAVFENKMRRRQEILDQTPVSDMVTKSRSAAEQAERESEATTRRAEAVESVRVANVFRGQFTAADLTEAQRRMTRGDEVGALLKQRSAGYDELKGNLAAALAGAPEKDKAAVEATNKEKLAAYNEETNRQIEDAELKHQQKLDASAAAGETARLNSSRRFFDAQLQAFNASAKMREDLERNADVKKAMVAEDDARRSEMIEKHKFELNQQTALAVANTEANKLRMSKRNYEADLKDFDATTKAKLESMDQSNTEEAKAARDAYAVQRAGQRDLIVEAERNHQESIRISTAKSNAEYIGKGKLGEVMDLRKQISIMQQQAGADQDAQENAKQYGLAQLRNFIKGNMNAPIGFMSTESFGEAIQTNVLRNSTNGFADAIAQAQGMMQELEGGKRLDEELPKAGRDLQDAAKKMDATFAKVVNLAVVQN